MPHPKRAAALAATCFLASCAAPPLTTTPASTAETAAFEPTSPEPAAFQRRNTDPGATAVQGLLGVSFYDDMKFTSVDPADPNNVAEADLSKMPTLGFAGHYRLFGQVDGFEGGLDGSLLLSWWSDSEVVAIGGGTAVVAVDTRVFITDIGFGMYLSQMVGPDVRFYAGVGPLVQFGNGKFEDESSSFSENGFGVGGYVRGGVEFRVTRTALLGIGIRATKSEIDFGGTIGDVNTDALQAFITYTYGF